MKKLTKKQIKELRIKETKEELVNLLAENDNTVYTDTLHTSKSGMMRSIVTTLKDGTNITDMVAEICDYKFHKTGGLKVIGCGTDVGFDIVYGLSVELYCEDGYNREEAYKLNQRWL